MTGKAGPHPHVPYLCNPPRAYKPPRDRKVPTKDAVSCPSCGVEAGSLCVKEDGVETSQCHSGRRRMALRLERETNPVTPTQPKDPR